MMGESGCEMVVGGAVLSVTGEAVGVGRAGSGAC